MSPLAAPLRLENLMIHRGYQFLLKFSFLSLTMMRRIVIPIILSKVYDRYIVSLGVIKQGNRKGRDRSEEKEAFKMKIFFKG